KRKMLSRERTLEIEPLLREEVVKGSGYYAEYRTDDARLTLEVLKTATQKGAEVVNYASVDSLRYENGKVCGVSCTDLMGNEQFEISSDFVVNASGPWVDELREKDNSLKGKRLHLTKGVHVVVPKEKLSLKQSVYFDVNDGRMIFAIPRFDVTYIGTTDTNYKGDIQNPEATLEDVNYILGAVNQMFPSVNLDSEDVISHWVGLRPLIHEDGKDPSELSRKDELFESESGLITIAGGKLTGYRLMAKKVIRLICDKKQITRKCKTRRIKLCGGNFSGAEEFNNYSKSIEKQTENLNIPAHKAAYLVHNYGKQTDDIIGLLGREEITSLIEAEALFALENDGVCTLNDFFIRRTGKMYYAPGEISSSLDKVSGLFASHLNWNEEKVIVEKGEVEKELIRIRTFSD
ncbi:MAG: glycerol-3-phosphate dehydrogenase/oxidase, partial [Crocinitomicaceae bacterium]|nr:glycerol-3-phosphate dehydrogenase/oxidase [Crocinitomicaceae bacterium]